MNFPKSWIEPVASRLRKFQQSLPGEDILKMGELRKEVPIDKEVQDYLVKVVLATHPEDPHASEQVKQFVRNGSSPRGAQSILAGARVRALLDGAVSCGEGRHRSNGCSCSAAPDYIVV